MTIQEYKNDIANFEKTIANPKTSEATKKALKSALEKAKAKLAELEEAERKSKAPAVKGNAAIDELKKDIAQFEKAIDNPKTSEATKKSLQSALSKAKAKLTELEKAGHEDKKSKPESKPVKSEKKVSDKGLPFIIIDGQKVTQETADFCEKVIKEWQERRQAKKTASQKSAHKSPVKKAQKQFTHGVDNVISAVSATTLEKGGVAIYNKLGATIADDLKDAINRLEIESKQKVQLYNAIKKSFSKGFTPIIQVMENGGEVEEVDLFAEYETAPKYVQEVIMEYSGEQPEMSEKDLKAMLAKMEAIGYTFYWGLYMIPYGLHKIDAEEQNKRNPIMQITHGHKGIGKNPLQKKELILHIIPKEIKDAIIKLNRNLNSDVLNVTKEHDGYEISTTGNEYHFLFEKAGSAKEAAVYEYLDEIWDGMDVVEYAKGGKVHKKSAKKKYSYIDTFKVGDYEEQDYEDAHTAIEGEFSNSNIDDAFNRIDVERLATIIHRQREEDVEPLDMSQSDEVQNYLTNLAAEYKNKRKYEEGGDIDSDLKISVVVYTDDGGEVVLSNVTKDEFDEYAKKHGYDTKKTDGSIVGYYYVNDNLDACVSLPSTYKVGEAYKFEDGGSIASQNKAMVASNNKQIKHHSSELDNGLAQNEEIPAWVVALSERAATDLSDITHYLDAKGVKKMAKGGSIDKTATVVVFSEQLGCPIPLQYPQSQKSAIEKALMEKGYKKTSGVPTNEKEFQVYKKGGFIKNVSLPNCNLILYGQKMDTNGNHVVKIGFPNERMFSIQTNGNLPHTHRIIKGKKAYELTAEELNTISKEVCEYVKEHGSKGQKKLLNEYGHLAKGGHVKFADKVEAIEHSLEGQPVPAKYRKEYGKKYTAASALEAAERIAGAMVKKEHEMEKGGQISGNYSTIKSLIKKCVDGKQDRTTQKSGDYRVDMVYEQNYLKLFFYYTPENLHIATYEKDFIEGKSKGLFTIHAQKQFADKILKALFELGYTYDIIRVEV